jgi:hypothetical protein
MIISLKMRCDTMSITNAMMDALSNSVSVQIEFCRYSCKSSRTDRVARRKEVETS